jgi:hypothetical protein
VGLLLPTNCYYLVDRRFNNFNLAPRLVELPAYQGHRLIVSMPGVDPDGFRSSEFIPREKEVRIIGLCASPEAELRFDPSALELGYGPIGPIRISGGALIVSCA